MAASEAPHEYQRAAREMKASVHTMAAPQHEGGEGDARGTGQTARQGHVRPCELVCGSGCNDQRQVAQH